ncbi:MAG TPA: Gfo/Idh/MocA family oxidoreductase [Anaerolineales bacterium]|nr:Gfo/Idh/MocA family oxidoreductase [Anaerolineales bacterium]
MTKTLIAGLGSIGRRHLRNLVALGETDIVLLRTHRSTLPEDDLAGYPVETDLRAALRRHSPEAVIVANPTALHLDVAIPAARAGCAILLEKPISNSMKGLRRLEAAVGKCGANVLVAFQFRFHPSLLAARKLIADGAIGRIISAEVHYGEYLPGWHPWEDYRNGYAARADLGGGVVLTQCHSLDYLPWLAGPVESAWGLVGKLSDLEVDVDDTAKIGLRFASGALGSLHLDYNQQPPSHSLMVVGTQGSLKCDMADGTVNLYRADSTAWESYPLPPGWERNLMFMEEMKHFLEVARGEAEPACTLADGIRVMRLIEAVMKSQRTGRMVSVD